MAMAKRAFDPKLLEFLVCPLSKAPLRYCKKTQELISDSLGVAYPIVGGIPNLIPLDGRIIEQTEETEEEGGGGGSRRSTAAAPE